MSFMSQKRPNICALLSFGNALIHFGLLEKHWDQSSPEFEHMIDVVSARHGSAISVDKVERRYPIEAKRTIASKIDREWVKREIDSGAVVALPIWDDGIGLHSVLVLDHVVAMGRRRFRVVNREPFTGAPPVNYYDWEVLGFRKWNVSVVSYRRKP